MTRNSYQFKRSFHDAIKQLPKDNRVSIYEAINNLIFEGIEPELEGIELSVFLLIRPQIEKIAATPEKRNLLFKSSEYFDKKIYWAAIHKIQFDSTKEIDFGHYYHAANDWSNGSGNKKQDWLATISSWIKRDIRNNTVKLKKSEGIKNKIK